MALNRPAILEEKKEEALLSAEQITAALEYIRKKILDDNFYQLNTIGYVSLEIVLNTLDFLTTEMVITRNYQSHNDLLNPGKEKTAVIHLENFFRIQSVQLGAAYSVLLNINELALWTDGPLPKGSMQFQCENSNLTCRVIDIDNQEKAIEIPWLQIQPLIGALELQDPNNADAYKTLVLENQKTFLYAVLGIASNLAIALYANDVANSHQNDSDAKNRADQTRHTLLGTHPSNETIDAFEKISLWKHPDWLNNLLVRSLLMPFIQSIHTIEDVERGLSMQIFCSMLEGDCIDGRTRSAITYAQSEYPDFPKLLENIFNEMNPVCIPDGPDGKYYSYFGCIETILNEQYWGKIFKGEHAAGGIRKLPGLLDVEVLCDEKTGVIYYLNDILIAVRDNSFLTLYENINNNEKQEIFFKLLLKEKDFLSKLTFTQLEQDQFDQLFYIDAFVKQLLLTPDIAEILFKKVSQEKRDNIYKVLYTHHFSIFRKMLPKEIMSDYNLLRIAIKKFSYPLFKIIYEILYPYIENTVLIKLFINTIDPRPENLTLLLSPAQLAESCLRDSHPQPLTFLGFVRSLQDIPPITLDYKKQFVKEILRQDIYKKIANQPYKPNDSRHLREFLNVISIILCAEEKDEPSIHSMLLTELTNNLGSHPNLVAKFIAEENALSEEKNVFPVENILKTELTSSRYRSIHVFPYLDPIQYSSFFNMLFEEKKGLEQFAIGCSHHNEKSTEMFFKVIETFKNNDSSPYFIKNFVKSFLKFSPSVLNYINPNKLLTAANKILCAAEQTDTLCHPVVLDFIKDKCPPSVIAILIKEDEDKPNFLREALKIVVKNPDNRFLAIINNLLPVYPDLWDKFIDKEFIANVNFTPEQQNQFDKLLRCYLLDYILKNKKTEQLEPFLRKASRGCLSRLNGERFYQILDRLGIEITFQLLFDRKVDLQPFISMTMNLICEQPAADIDLAELCKNNHDFFLECVTIQNMPNQYRNHFINDAFAVILSVFKEKPITKDDKLCGFLRRANSALQGYEQKNDGTFSDPRLLKCLKEANLLYQSQGFIEDLPLQDIEALVNYKDPENLTFLLKLIPDIRTQAIQRALLQPFFHNDTCMKVLSSLPLATQKHLLILAFRKVKVEHDNAADECLQDLINYIHMATNAKRIIPAAKAMYVLLATSPPHWETLRAICDAVKKDHGVSFFTKSDLASLLSTYLKKSLLSAPYCHQKSKHS